MRNKRIDISYKSAGQFEDSRFEKIHNVVVSDATTGSIYVANEIANLIKKKHSNGEFCVLGLATGSSPIKVYDELVRMHKEDGLSFSNVVTFNLDEYHPMDKNSIHSYSYFMKQHLFDHVDILPENINIPDGTISNDKLQEYCLSYELKIQEYGGLDFQLLGIGRTGHIGFNEPGAHYNSGTRNITLDHMTRVDATASFLEIDNVPKRAITMGVGTVRKAKRIILLAWGYNKASIIKETIEGVMSSEVPATYLQEHTNTTFILNEGASEELTRIKTPWLVGPCDWSQELVAKAILWLSEVTNKSLLKLTDKDYNNHGMSGLLSYGGPAYDLNIKIFNKLQRTITGWPGGKPNSDDSKRPESSEPIRKRILIFSPHPVDDVIGMGGTLDRLVKQGHEVHVAYQTSGNIAVTNYEALKYAEVAKDINCENKNVHEIIHLINSKDNGTKDDIRVLRLKGIIRKSEAFAALRYVGVSNNQIHFLNLPFYETGTIKKKPITEKDIQKVYDLIDEIKPHQIYAAGDLSDPHGTYKLCLDVIFDSLKLLKNKEYMNNCKVWLYSGAWHEWEIHQIDMAIPMSPDQVLKKRQAIFFHQSQKDGVMFQGNDTREFWLRAEDRNNETAQKYHQLGLADYEAIEAFKRHHFY